MGGLIVRFEGRTVAINAIGEVREFIWKITARKLDHMPLCPKHVQV